MARPIWTGSISFGLVAIPVKLYSAVQDTDIHFHLLSSDGRCRLKQKLFCPKTGKEYDYNETVRGYEVAPERYVLMDQEELDKLRPRSGRSIDIEDFVALEEIDPIFFERPYYVMPDERGTKAFGLLVEAMRETGRVALARFVMRNKEYLAALREYQGRLCLETMRFADEIRSVDELGESPAERAEKPDKREVKLARDLVEALTAKFQPQKYKNNYREAVLELVQSKAKGQEVHISESPAPKATNVVDLMEVLKASLNKKKRAAAEREEGEHAEGRRRQTKRRARG